MDAEEIFFCIIIVIVIAGIIATILLPEEPTSASSDLRESINLEIVRSPTEGRSTQASPRLDFTFLFYGHSNEETQLNKRYFYCVIIIGGLMILIFLVLIVAIHWFL